MSILSHPISVNFPLARTVVMAALMSATFLASPLTAARANPAANPPLQLAQNAPQKTLAATQATSDKADTVEARITSLHAELKITPAEDAAWNGVAQAMRENVANLEKLVAEKRTQAPQNMTALDDLTTYQKFAQAHVDGLKNLTSAFTSLYDAMPAAQKTNADQVLRNFWRENTRSHGQQG
jgi:periplasmic protein CpxP/Spy